LFSILNALNLIDFYVFVPKIKLPKRQSRGDPVTQSYLSTLIVERGAVEMVNGLIVTTRPALFFDGRLFYWRVI